MTDRISIILRVLGLTAVLLLLPLPLSSISFAATQDAGFAMSADLEPCPGQDNTIAGEPCCFVCPPALLALPQRCSGPGYLASATALPEPERAQGLDPEPLRRPPRG